MGLDTTHDAWHGGYGSFMTWRRAVCQLAGLGDLDGFIGFGGSRSFSEISKDGLRVLLSHSDCDGELSPSECKAVADDLLDLLPAFNEQTSIDREYLKDKTEQFINGCMAAYHLNETLYFE